MSKILFLTETQEDKISLFERILAAFDVKSSYGDIEDRWCTIETMVGGQLSIKEAFDPYSENLDKVNGWEEVMFDRRGSYRIRNNWIDYTDLVWEGGALEGTVDEMFQHAVKFLEARGYKQIGNNYEQ